jgi:hypothetical protein
LLITLPATPEETEPLADVIVVRVAEWIGFPHARLKVFGGLIVATRIPENADEAREVGDGLCFVKLQMQEVPIHPKFDPKQHTQGTSSGQHILLLQQFNSAKQLESVVEQYLGLFKVLEKAYARGRGGNLLRALQGSEDLWELAQSTLIKYDSGMPAGDRNWFNSLLATLIRICDNCAHLRGRTGYTPGDPRIRSEVEPRLVLVAALAQACVERHLR